MEKCVEAVHVCCSSKRLQLNPSKSKIIWFGTRATLKHLQNTDLRLHVGADTIAPSEMVLDLGVFLDSELTMRQHVGKVAILCYYHLRHFKKVRRILGPTITSRLVSAFVTSRLDYCKALLAGLSKSTIAQLQRVQNAAVCLPPSRQYQTSWQSGCIATWALLASDSLSDHLQAVLDDAQCSYRPHPALRQRDANSDSVYAKSKSPKIVRQHQVLTASPSSQDRRTRVLVLWTCILEQSVEWHYINYGHFNI